MKKLLTTLYTTGFLLASAPFAFAATFGSPCPGDSFNAVCNPSGGFGDLIRRIIFYLFLAGVIAAIIFLVWGGIKWIMSGGDKAKVESARNTVIGAIIGLIIIFASYFIITVVLSTFFNININSIDLPILTS